MKRYDFRNDNKNDWDTTAMYRSFLQRAGAGLFGFFTLVLLASCKPVISFTGSSLLDEQGNEYGVLSWHITSKDTDDFQLAGVTIEPGIGAVEPVGSLEVYPAQTTTYTLTAYSLGPNNTIYNDTRSVTIHIGPRVDFDLVEDPALRACLEDTGFTHIEQFTVIYCVARGIESLAGIEQFVAAQSASLDFNRIADLTPLAALPNLGIVSITSNDLVSLDALASSSSVHSIIAFDNAIADVSVLAGMSQLRSLVLDDNRLDDFSGLETLTMLQALSVKRNGLTDVSGLANLAGLRALDFSYNPVTTGVPALSSLRSAVAIRSEGNGSVRCLDYADLVLALGPVVIFDKCRLF